MALECSVIELTPALARDMLARNTANRQLRRAYVQQLAGAMQRGEWRYNGEPIQVADDGQLLNGQHRLHAVVESGIPIQALLICGLPATTQRSMDSGARRSLSDVLALRGERDTTNLAAALTLLHRFRTVARMDQDSRTAPTIAEALQLLDREPEVRLELTRARPVYRATKMRVSAAAALARAFESAVPQMGHRFFDELCEVRPANPAISQLSQLLNDFRTQERYRLRIGSLCAVTIEAFNAWREDRPLDEAAIDAARSGKRFDPFPEIAPSPK